MSITLESLKEEVDTLRYTVGMADSDAVETKQLLRAQTSLLNALREDQRGISAKLDSQSRVLSEQAVAIGELVLHQNTLQHDIREIGHRMTAIDERLGARIDGVEQGLGARIDTVEQGLGARIDGVEKGLGARIDAAEQGLGARIDGVEQRIDGVEQRIDGVEQRLGGRMDVMDRRMDKMDGRMDKMDRNIEAIMDHMGIGRGDKE